MATRRQSGIMWCEDRVSFDRAAADYVAAHLAHHPRGAVALPTGQTPLGLYRELVARVESNQVDMQQARYFNLDEYVGLASDHPLSYAYFLQQNLLQPAAVPASRVRLLRGEATDLEAEAHAYDAAIDAAGGLELAILGLGTNGHIAFNEPGTDWQTRTHIVQLSSATRFVHHTQNKGRFTIPVWAITTGIATLRAARRILLLVAGAKADALAAWTRGIPDPQWPVTSLLDHPDLTLIVESDLQGAVADA